MQWNLERLAETLTPLAPAAALGSALAAYGPAFRDAFDAAMLDRLGIGSAGPDEDHLLVESMLAFLEASRVGFDRFFFDWYGGPASAGRAARSPFAAHYAGAPLRGRSVGASTNTPSVARPAQPYWQRQAPCSLLIDEIEALWAAIAERDDWTPFDAKLDAIDELRRAVAR